MNKRICFTLFFILALSSLISAYPGIPHQFYGSVEVNGQPAPDNNILVASIEGDSYATVTQDGRYGFAPNIFYIEDPKGNRAGDVIFYLGGKEVGISVFENNGYTNLDFSVTTTCGDSYCLGDETCTSCQNDCGICTDPPQINIISPENKVYDTAKIALIVTSDQTILVWMYAFNSDDLVTFTPDITLTAQEGENNVTIVGINQNFQSGSSYVEFTVELPIETCSDGIQNQGETGVDCGGSCSACPSSGGGGSSGGSNGGGGGGGSRGDDSSLSSTGGSVNTGTPSTQETESVDGGITGGVIGAFGTGGMAILAIILVIIVIGLIIIVSRKKK